MADENGTISRVRTQTDIPLIPCTSDRFAGLTKEVNDYGINQEGWFCPQNVSYQLQGQTQSTNQTRFRLIVRQCTNSTSQSYVCASSSEITTLASESRISIATLNSYFKEDEYNDVPIKRSLNVEPFPIAIGLTQTIQRSLRKNIIYTKDSWVSANFDNKEYMFYQDIPGTIKTATSTTDFMIFTYSCDSQENFVTRKVLSLADAAASAGGFASIVLLFARLIAQIYAKPFFYQSILRKLYQYEVFRAQPDKEFSYYKANDDEQKVEQLKELLNNRRSLQLDVLKEFLKSILCRCIPKFRRSIQFKLYQQGVEQLQNALDIEKVLRTIQKVQTLERIVLKEYQRKLLKFSTRHIIRPIKPSIYSKDAYEVKSRQETYIKELVKKQKLAVNRALIQEIMGYKPPSIHISTNALKDYSKVAKTKDSRNELDQMRKSPRRNKTASQTVFEFSEQDSKRELFKSTALQRKKSSKNGVRLDVQDF